MNDLIERILFFGFTKEQAQGAYKFGYRAVVIGTLVAGWGGLAFIGIPHFAMASDVDKKIEQVQSKVVKRLDEQQTQVASLAATINRQLASSVATQIRSLVAKRCKAKDSDEREQINREIDRLQDEYKEYRTNEYRTPTCSDL